MCHDKDKVKEENLSFSSPFVYPFWKDLDAEKTRQFSSAQPFLLLTKVQLQFELNFKIIG